MTAAAVVADGELVLPGPVGKQVEWLDSPATRKVLRIGRRGGKTRFALIAALAGHGPGWDEGTPAMPGVLQGGDVIWIAQDYPNLTRVVWREEIKPRFAHLPWAKLNERDHALTLEGLGTLFLVSAEAINGIRGMGKKVVGIVVDEAAWLALSAALQDVILFVLADNNGWLIVMSTTNAGPDGGYDETGAPQIPSFFNVLCADILAGKRSAEWEQFVGTAFENPAMSPEAIQAVISEYVPDSPKLKQEMYVELLETGVGLALPGLAEKTHMCDAFQPPEHWTEFASFDWGYHHPWSMGRFTVDEDGGVYKRDTLTGRLDLPEQVDKKARAAGFDPKRVVVHAGGDIWRARMKKGEFAGPTIAEELMKLGWRLIPANDARVAGLNNIRRYTYIDPARPDAKPRFQWMRTPGNVLCLAQMARMPLDPDNPEDALKIDADSAGRGGDDCYDETRYGLMSRPLTSIPVALPDRQGQSMGYDYAHQRPRERETGEQVMEQLMGSTPSPTAGRFRVPVRRGR